MEINDLRRNSNESEGILFCCTVEIRFCGWSQIGAANATHHLEAKVKGDTSVMRVNEL